MLEHHKKLYNIVALWKMWNIVENYVEKSDEKFTSFPQWKTFSTKKLLIE